MARGPTVRYVKDYAVQELLGKGAFGCVYQAKKDTGETLFAMKELPLDMVSVHGGGSGEELRDSDGEQSATLLEREVQILSTLQHPNIIRYYDSFQQGDSFYIVMELVEGATLLDHLNSLSEKRQSMAEPRSSRRRFKISRVQCGSSTRHARQISPGEPPATRRWRR